MRSFSFLTVLWLLILTLSTAGCSRSVKEYTLDVDAFRDNVTGTILDSKGKPITGTAKTFFNGVLVSETSYRKGLQDGVQRLFYDSGEILSENTFKDGKRVGPWKFYYKSGTLNSETLYKGEKGESISRGYYESGELRSETPYKYRKMDGVSKYYYKSGKLWSELLYKDDKAEGLMKEYYEDGKLMRESPYKEGKLEGVLRQYFKDAVLEVQYKNGIAESGFCVIENGERNPLSGDDLTAINSERRVNCGTADEPAVTMKFYDEDGNIRDIDTVWDNVSETMLDSGGKPVTGTEKYFNENGTIRAERTYKDGKRDGVSKIYNNGALIIEMPFKNGKKEGVLKLYDKNGKLGSERSYKNDLADGLSRSYSKNGEVYFEVLYKNGVAESGFTNISGEKVPLSDEELTTLSSE
jgi:antitoxin component YwqK of YwqJK toxin-antitoxin module